LIMLSIYEISCYKNWLNKEVEFTVDNAFNLRDLVLQELVKQVEFTVDNAFNLRDLVLQELVK
jgi:hypothetical protein